MTRKRNAKTTADPETTAALAEFFAPDGDSGRVDFGDIDWLAFGRLTSALTGRGALVSIYIGSSDGTLRITVSAGEQRRSYAAADVEQFDQLIEGLIIRAGVKREVPTTKP